MSDRLCVVVLVVQSGVKGGPYAQISPFKVCTESEGIRPGYRKMSCLAANQSILLRRTCESHFEMQALVSMRSKPFRCPTRPHIAQGIVHPSVWAVALYVENSVMGLPYPP